MIVLLSPCRILTESVADGIRCRRNQLQTTAVPQCGDVFIRDVKAPEAVHSRLTNAQHGPKDPSSVTTNSVRTREQAGSAGESTGIPTTSSEQHGTFCSEQRREQSCRISGNAWISWRVSPWCEDAGPLIFSHEGLR